MDSSNKDIINNLPAEKPKTDEKYPKVKESTEACPEKEFMLDTTVSSTDKPKCKQSFEELKRSTDNVLKKCDRISTDFTQIEDNVLAADCSKQSNKSLITVALPCIGKTFTVEDSNRVDLSIIENENIEESGKSDSAKRAIKSSIIEYFSTKFQQSESDRSRTLLSEDTVCKISNCVVNTLEKIKEKINLQQNVTRSTMSEGITDSNISDKLISNKGDTKLIGENILEEKQVADEKKFKKFERNEETCCMCKQRFSTPIISPGKRKSEQMVEVNIKRKRSGDISPTVAKEKESLNYSLIERDDTFYAELLKTLEKKLSIVISHDRMTAENTDKKSVAQNRMDQFSIKYKITEIASETDFETREIEASNTRSPSIQTLNSDKVLRLNSNASASASHLISQIERSFLSSVFESEKANELINVPNVKINECSSKDKQRVRLNEYIANEGLSKLQDLPEILDVVLPDKEENKLETAPSTRTNERLLCDIPLPVRHISRVTSKPEASNVFKGDEHISTNALQCQKENMINQRRISPVPLFSEPGCALKPTYNEARSDFINVETMERDLEFTEIQKQILDSISHQRQPLANMKPESDDDKFPNPLKIESANEVGRKISFEEAFKVYVLIQLLAETLKIQGKNPEDFSQSQLHSILRELAINYDPDSLPNIAYVTRNYKNYLKQSPAEIKSAIERCIEDKVESSDRALNPVTLTEKFPDTSAVLVNPNIPHSSTSENIPDFSKTDCPDLKENLGLANDPSNLQKDSRYQKKCYKHKSPVKCVIKEKSKSPENKPCVTECKISSLAEETPSSTEASTRNYESEFQCITEKKPYPDMLPPRFILTEREISNENADVTVNQYNLTVNKSTSDNIIELKSFEMLVSSKDGTKETYIKLHDKKQVSGNKTLTLVKSENICVKSEQDSLSTPVNSPVKRKFVELVEENKRIRSTDNALVEKTNDEILTDNLKAQDSSLYSAHLKNHEKHSVNPVISIDDAAEGCTKVQDNLLHPKDESPIQHKLTNTTGKSDFEMHKIQMSKNSSSPYQTRSRDGVLLLEDSKVSSTENRSDSLVEQNLFLSFKDIVKGDIPNSPNNTKDESISENRSKDLKYEGMATKNSNKFRSLPENPESDLPEKDKFVKFRTDLANESNQHSCDIPFEMSRNSADIGKSKVANVNKSSEHAPSEGLLQQENFMNELRLRQTLEDSPTAFGHSDCHLIPVSNEQESNIINLEHMENDPEFIESQKRILESISHQRQSLLCMNTEYDDEEKFRELFKNTIPEEASSEVPVDVVLKVYGLAQILRESLDSHGNKLEDLSELELIYMLVGLAQTFDKVCIPYIPHVVMNYRDCLSQSPEAIKRAYERLLNNDGDLDLETLMERFLDTVPLPINPNSPDSSTSENEIEPDNISQRKSPEFREYPGLATNPNKVKKDARYQKKFYKRNNPDSLTLNWGKDSASVSVTEPNVDSEEKEMQIRDDDPRTLFLNKEDSIKEESKDPKFLVKDKGMSNAKCKSTEDEVSATSVSASENEKPFRKETPSISHSDYLKENNENKSPSPIERNFQVGGLDACFMPNANLVSSLLAVSPQSPSLPDRSPQSPSLPDRSPQSPSLPKQK